MTKLQERARGDAVGTRDKRGDETEPIGSGDSSVGREPVTMAGKHELKQRLAIPRREVGGITSMDVIEGRTGRALQGRR